MSVIRAKVYYERQCRRCRRTVRAFVFDYGEVTPENLDEKVGAHDFPVAPVRCPGCGGEEWPERFVCMDEDKGRVVIAARLGSADMPVKEYAADTGMPVGYCRGSGVESVIREAAALMKDRAGTAS